MSVFTELNLQTHLTAIFVLCVPIYKLAFAIIYLTVIPFFIIDVLYHEEGFHLFVFYAS